MSLAGILSLLEEGIGLNPASLGTSTVPSAVDERMRQLQLGSHDDYREYLTRHAEEFQALVEALVVPETWFFRGGELFNFLAEHINKVTHEESRRFRVLSIPCSTGEEPYSLAIALTDLGVPPESWSIEGVDLSDRNLKLARRGMYSEFSFRQTDEAWRARHFRKVEGGWELDPGIRFAVRFSQGNLASPVFLPIESMFDLILCRNLLIYFHDAARDRALANLDRLLAPRGLLCVGHADPGTMFGRPFERTGPDGHFIFRRKPAEVRPAPLTAPRTNSLTLPARPRREPLAAPSPRSYPPTPAMMPVTEDLLQRARQQADAGELVDALASCRIHLLKAGPSAELYSLMGVIRQAQREDADAIDCFQRALYLQPRHQEALLHLMLLYQQQGNSSQAAMLRRRLDRTSPGEQS